MADVVKTIKKALLTTDEAIGLYLYTDNGWADIAASAYAAAIAAAETEERYSGPDGVYDEDTPLGRRGNAFRHCVWSCLMCAANGEAKALQAGTYHEDFNEGIQRGNDKWNAREEGERLIDLRNNREGLKCCKSSKKNCLECCKKTDWWDWESTRGKPPIVRKRDAPITAPKGKAPTTTPKDRGKEEPAPSEPDEPPPKRPDEPENGEGQVRPPEGPEDPNGAFAISRTQTGSAIGARARQGSSPFRFDPLPLPPPLDPPSEWPPKPPNYDPCAVASNWCPTGSWGGGGAWQPAEVGLEVQCFIESCYVVAKLGARRVPPVA